MTERWGIQNGSAYIQTHRVNISASWVRITDLLSLICPTARETKKFRFDRRWISKSGFENIVQEGWIDIESNDNISLHDRIKWCRSTNARWRREENYNTQKILEELKDKLDRSQVDQSLSAAEVSSIKAAVIRNSTMLQPNNDVQGTISVAWMIAEEFGARKREK